MDSLKPQIFIQVLGGFSITCDGQELLRPGSSTRLAMLLAFLILKRIRRASRAQVAYLFWQDSTDKQARSNLRGLLTALRKQAPLLAACVIDEKTHLGWRNDPAQVIDVEAFEAALAVASEQSENVDAAIDALKQAIALYKGELLPDFYEDWVLAERFRLQTAYLDALCWLIELLEKSDRLQEALHFAGQLWQADPLRESSALHLMRLCAAAGDRARALVTYARCSRLLLDELGVEPGPAIQALHQRLLQMPEQAPSRSRQVADAPSPAPIGRAGQWTQLVECWECASAGVARVALITGEAGIGKSHLARAFGDWCGAQGVVVLTSTCPQSSTPAPFVALAPLLAAPQLAHRLERLEDADMACLQMLSPALRRRYVHRDLEAQASPRLQLRLQQALTALLCDPSELTLLILDDAQWCDELSFEWLHFLFAMEPHARLLVVMTASEGDSADLPFQRAAAALRSKGHLRRIEMQRLSCVETAQLAQQSASLPLDERTIARLYEASLGNPFFVVELVKMLEQTAEDHLAADALPASISALVLHRLSLLSPPARQLLDVAAVIGAQFSIDILRWVDRLPEITRVQAIEELWRSALIREVSADVYAFQHELVRAVIYRQISDVRRRHLHRRIAEAISEQSADDSIEPVPQNGVRIVHHPMLAGYSGRSTPLHVDSTQDASADAAFWWR